MRPTPNDFESRLNTYEALLLKWSTNLNLVSKSTLNNIRSRHFADSLQLVPLLSKNDNIVDIGTGAGFPGMVLALYGFDVTLVESDQKKCVFLENVSRETNVPVKIICSRIESYFPINLFDVICSRGVASLSSLISISQHLSKKGHSRGLFLKGKNVEDEIVPALQKSIIKIPSAINYGSYIIEYKY